MNAAPHELVVTADLPGAALGLWEDVAPRTAVLAGGNTPRGFYEVLASERERLRLDLVDYYFGDERCVAPTHDDSNFRMASEALLSKLADPARVHRMHGETCDAEGYEDEIRGTEFDVVLLGLGTDGHTCSLFPGDPALTERERLVSRVERPDHTRLTLTFPAVDSAAVGVFLVSGREKGDALAGLLRRDAAMPAARVSCPRLVVIADEEAAEAAGARS